MNKISRRETCPKRKQITNCCRNSCNLWLKCIDSSDRYPLVRTVLITQDNRSSQVGSVIMRQKHSIPIFFDVRQRKVRIRKNRKRYVSSYLLAYFSNNSCENIYITCLHLSSDKRKDTIIISFSFPFAEEYFCIIIAEHNNFLAVFECIHEPYS